MGSSASTSAWTAERIPSLDGLEVIVTGASSGIGLETTRQLVLHGATVTMAVRNAAKTEPLAAQLTEEIRTRGSRGSVVIEIVDMEDLDSVRAFASRYKSTHTKLDVLVNNAGIFIPSVRTRTKQGLDQQMGVNHHAAAVLTIELLPLLKTTPKSRVVAVSSDAAKHGKERVVRASFEADQTLSAMNLYSSSKMCNLLFTRELNSRLRAQGHAHPIALASHPGFTATNAQSAGKKGFVKAVLQTASAMLAQNVTVGALSAIRAAVDPSAQENTYYGPPSLTGFPVVLRKPSPADDDELARWVWQSTAEKTGTNLDAAI